MSQENAKGLRGFLSATALSPYAVVRRDSNGKAALCGVGLTPMGSTGADRIGAANKHVTVRLMSYAGTRKLIGALAITAGQKVYPAASGKVSNVPGRAGEKARWFALETSTAADELIECADFYGEDVGEDFVYAMGGAGDIVARDLVYASAQVGAIPTVLKAQATSGGLFASHFSPNAIAAGAFDEVVKSHLLIGTVALPVDTSGGTVGDPVYLSDAAAGGWTLTKPTATDKVQEVGRVVTVSATIGAIQFDLSGSVQITHTHETAAEGGGLTSPHVTTSIEDAAGKTILALNPTAGSVVNWGKLTNELTGQPVVFEAEGETNVDLILRAKGNGTTTIGQAGGEVQLGTTTTDKIGVFGTTPVVQEAHIADPTAMVALTHTAGTGADGTTPAGAEYNKARDDLTALKVAVDANKAAIDAVLADLALYGLQAAT